MPARRTAALAALVAVAALTPRARAQDEGPKPWSFRTEDRISRIAPSPDGTKLYLGDQTGVVWIHDAADGKQVGKIEAHKGEVRALSFVGADPALLVSSSRPEFVRLFDGAKGAERRRFEFPGNPAPEERDASGDTISRWDHVFSLAVSRDTPLIAMADPTHRLVVWDAAKDAEVAASTFENWATGASISPDASRIALAIASDDERRVEVRPLGGGAPLWRDAVNESDADEAARNHRWQEVEFSPDGGTLLAWGWSSEDNRRFGGMRAYDAATGKRRWTRLYDFQIWDVAYAPGGDRIALSSPRGVSLFDAQTGDEVIGLESSSGVMADVAFSPDGRFLYAAPLRAEGIVRWDVSGEVKVVTPPAPRAAPKIAAPTAAPAAPAGKPSPGGAKTTAISHGAGVTSLAVSPDGARLATGGADGAVRVWEAASGSATAQFTGVGGGVTWLGWIGGDRDRLAACGDDGKVRSFSISSRSKRCEFDAQTAEVPDEKAARLFIRVAASPASPELFVAALGAGVSTYDADTGAQRSKTDVLEPGRVPFLPQAVAVSPNGRRFVAMGTDISRKSEGRVYDRDRAGTTWSVSGLLSDGSDASPVDNWKTLAISRDGTSVVGVADCVSLERAKKGVKIQCVVRCWDLASRALRWRAELEIGADAAALSPRGDLFAIARAGGVRLLSMTDGAEKRTLPAESAAVTALAFSPDGARLYGGTKSGSVLTWNVSGK